MFDDLNRTINNSGALGAKDEPPAKSAFDNSAAFAKTSDFIPSAPASVVDSPAAAKPVAEDIFMDTEQPTKPEVFRHSADKNGAGRVIDPEMVVPSRIPKAVLISLVAVSGLALLGYGAYWGYNWFTNRSVTPVLENNTPFTEEIPAENKAVLPADNQPAAANSETPAAENKITAPVAAIDSDQDGLSDEEELRIGTNPNNIDSDNDGLFDREEVEVYKTDPKNPDTDGDSYKDGDEVKGGYNPNGPGKLFQN